MSGDSAPFNLTNHFLIAMPGLDDAMFSKSVVFVCEHSPRGALGLIINKAADMPLTALFEKIDLPLQRADLQDHLVFMGGPVQTERGFVLHEPVDTGDSTATDSLYASTMTIPGGLEMTTSRDVLEALSMGSGPKRVLVTLGYSSWAEGQLESELSENSWLTAPANASIIFDTPIAQRYDQALALLGLQSWMISHQVGHA
jgi:putative transcriptional regulator